MIKYIRGDLFESNADIIAHGVNCSGGFGSGVAGQMAFIYPQTRTAYLEKYNQEGWELVDIQTVPLVDDLGWFNGKHIINCATQDEYLPRGVRHADYNAIRKAMEEVKAFAKFKGNQSIAMPKIGAGLAGGDWNVIEGILNEVFDDYDVTVYYL